MTLMMLLLGDKPIKLPVASGPLTSHWQDIKVLYLFPLSFLTFQQLINSDKKITILDVNILDGHKNE